MVRVAGKCDLNPKPREGEAMNRMPTPQGSRTGPSACTCTMKQSIGPSDVAEVAHLPHKTRRAITGSSDLSGHWVRDLWGGGFRS